MDYTSGIRFYFSLLTLRRLKGLSGTFDDDDLLCLIEEISYELWFYLLLDTANDPCFVVMLLVK